MKRLPIAVAMLLVIASSTAAQTLSDADVTTAVQAGQSKKFDHLVANCIAGAGFGAGMAAGLAGGVQPDGAFNVTVSANAGRIAFMAADAKRLYKPFAAADVPEDMRAAAIFVFADPQKPSHVNKTISVASPIERIVLKSKSNAEAVAQPAKFDTEPVEWSNLVGGKVDGTRGLARFDLAAVKELPPGDFDVVLVTQAGERRCKIGASARAKLFPAK